jgi:hypothetical protein
MGTSCDLSWIEIVMDDELELSLYQYEMSLIMRSCRAEQYYCVRQQAVLVTLVCE